MPNPRSQRHAAPAHAAINARIDAIAMACRAEMTAALSAIDGLCAALAALDGLDTRYVAAVPSCLVRRGRHDQSILAPFLGLFAEALADRLWQASPALCAVIGFWPDTGKPSLPDAALLAAALADAPRWRVDLPPTTDEEVSIDVAA